jgi:HipA-like protein
MRKAEVLFKGKQAGVLTHLDDGKYVFRYADSWINNIHNPPISLTFPTNTKEFKAEFLFPFFYNMLPEGYNKNLTCKTLKIDENDDFGLLISTANYDTIGAVTVHKI